MRACWLGACRGRTPTWPWELQGVTRDGQRLAGYGQLIPCSMQRELARMLWCPPPHSWALQYRSCSAHASKDSPVRDLLSDLNVCLLPASCARQGSGRGPDHLLLLPRGGWAGKEGNQLPSCSACCASCRSPMQAASCSRCKLHPVIFTADTGVKGSVDASRFPAYLILSILRVWEVEQQAACWRPAGPEVQQAVLPRGGAPRGAATSTPATAVAAGRAGAAGAQGGGAPRG